ncbi:hypothetical protein SAMN05421578_107180 [Paenibacillus macquariensis]|uniref:Uncharacterized protein n=1 Tax=Paenibacillus macquariensis TaxID=948756 RepID=A0ABY1K1M1_9BACL|nr:hypothetical protein SAMN05421578_107180 [Paenibacillus macquariensis]
MNLSFIVLICRIIVHFVILRNFQLKNPTSLPLRELLGSYTSYSTRVYLVFVKLIFPFNPEVK